MQLGRVLRQRDVHRWRLCASSSNHWASIPSSMTSTNHQSMPATPYSYSSSQKSHWEFWKTAWSSACSICRGISQSRNKSVKSHQNSAYWFANWHNRDRIASLICGRCRGGRRCLDPWDSPLIVKFDFGSRFLSRSFEFGCLVGTDSDWWVAARSPLVLVVSTIMPIHWIVLHRDSEKFLQWPGWMCLGPFD